MTLFLLLAILLGFIIPYFQRRRARLTFSSHRRRYYLRKATITTFWGVASLLVAFFLWFSESVYNACFSALSLKKKSSRCFCCVARGCVLF